MGKKSKKQAYVVFQGRTTGIFRTWPECQAQVHGFKGQHQRGFDTLDAAERAWNEHLATMQKQASARTPTAPKPSTTHHPFRPQDGNPQSEPATLKRPLACIDLTNSDNENDPTTKRRQVDNGRGTMRRIDNDPDPDVVLTLEQRAVLDMALEGENIFLTGAAGCGKTFTLKKILATFRDKKISYEVVAPTGIAALPLGGKTTYSFLGWKPDSLRLSIEDLKFQAKDYVKNVVKSTQVLVMEEISMVENQFLERMNLQIQSIMESEKPFGGKQVIILGDFYQLPPVKPFQSCLHCGDLMRPKPVIKCRTCVGTKQFEDEDKWAFKAPVWSQLGLRMVCLRKIHRQKDARYQDILNKLRYGLHLTEDEWHDLEKPKKLPVEIYPVKLMSMTIQVAELNNFELERIQSPSRSWKSLDDYWRKYPKGDFEIDPPWAIDQPLKDHRLPVDLKLKIGAKVMLLVNLDPKRKLVNGTQGEVIDFEVPSKPEKGKPDPLRFKMNNKDSTDDLYLEPVVRFANGEVRKISPFESRTQFGTNQRPYLACRTQIPLMLAWALSIHKSQGMTLDYIEVSSQKIFQGGQTYVALSRGTSLEGLTVTGYDRNLIAADSTVVEFYENTKWEDFSQPPPQTEYDRQGNHRS